jgi:hypothetical protein
VTQSGAVVGIQMNPEVKFVLIEFNFGGSGVIPCPPSKTE